MQRHCNPMSVFIHSKSVFFFSECRNPFRLHERYWVSPNVRYKETLFQHCTCLVLSQWNLITLGRVFVVIHTMESAGNLQHEGDRHQSNRIPRLVNPRGKHYVERIFISRIHELLYFYGNTGQQETWTSISTKKAVKLMIYSQWENREWPYEIQEEFLNMENERGICRHVNICVKER